MNELFLVKATEYKYIVYDDNPQEAVEYYLVVASSEENAIEKVRDKNAGTWTIEIKNVV